MSTVCPGVCPPTSIASIPGATSSRLSNVSSRPSPSTVSRYAISSSSTEWWNCRRVPCLPRQKASSFAEITTSECGKCERLPMWS